jgi:transcriptional antiterminator RfaH
MENCSPNSKKSDESDSSESWYCVRTQPKHEHVAAARLQSEGVNVFSPRIRFRRPTRRGAVWFTEALFPGYIFARFNLRERLAFIHHASGVRGVVRFGESIPIVEAGAIEELRTRVGGDGTVVLEQTIFPGDAVKVVTGALRGLEAVVERVLPARDRVCLLLDFLGRTATAEVSGKDLVKSVRHPLQTD